MNSAELLKGSPFRYLQKMPLFELSLSDDDDPTRLTKNDYAKFDESLFGLGDIDAKAHSVEAIVAVLDLEGFTKFCARSDAENRVPDFVRAFLRWTVAKIKTFAVEASSKRENDGHVYLRHPLPWFLKFTGDGVLFLWKRKKNMPWFQMFHIMDSLIDLSTAYKGEFYPKYAARWSYVPKKLRCGFSCGQVYPVGPDSDFAGACINIAARLQKLKGITFAFNRSSLNNPDEFDGNVGNVFVFKHVQLAGLGDEELVGILRTEYETMSVEDKNGFRDVL